MSTFTIDSTNNITASSSAEEASHASECLRHCDPKAELAEVTTMLTIDPEFRELIAPLATEEYAGLKASILAEGCRDALIVWAGTSILVDGHTRYRICQEHGVPFSVTPMEFADREAAADWIDANQLARRNLAPDQKTLIIGRRYNRTKKAQSNPSGVNQYTEVSGQSVHQPKTAETIAAKCGVSERTVRRAGKVAVMIDELAKTHPEEAKAVRTGRKRINEVQQQIKKQQKQAVVERIKREPKAPPKGPFRVIVIDPPWKYSSRADDATHRARNPYPDMTLDEIKALPIARLAHEECVLWLWTTNAFQRDAYDCLDAWGFEFKTALIWVKDRIGLGDWLRGQTEPCLMAVRGRPVVTLTNQSTALHAPVREHSRKPDEFFALVESLCPGNKLEMFARQPRKGWQSWGAELEATFSDAPVAEYEVLQ